MKGREFTEWLRCRSDEQLRALVTARPELVTPVPADIDGLAARASSPSALGRALDRLDRFTLCVLETLVVVRPGRADLRSLLVRASYDTDGESGDLAPYRMPATVPEPAPGPAPEAIPGPAHETASEAAPGPAHETAPGAALERAVETALETALDRLRENALVYDPHTGDGQDGGVDGVPLPAPGVAEALDPPAGLGPPAAEVFRHHPPERIEAMLAAMPSAARRDGSPRRNGSAPAERLVTRLSDPATVARLVAEVSPQARAALDDLTWGPASGRLPNARREVTAATARTPIDQLLARGLIGATGEEAVALPREVALFLRNGRLHRNLSPQPPEPVGTVRDPGLAGRTAAGQAFMFVRTVEELCEWWSADPPGVLRAGGLAIRDLKRVTQTLDVPEWVAGLVVEVAHAAGLIADGDGEWLPTDAYDSWRIRAVADRWAGLAAAWVGMDRVPGLIGERDERDRPLNALHPGLRRAGAGRVRAQVLSVLASAAPGVAPTVESVLARLAWERPRQRVTRLDRIVELALREAEHLGVTGLGVLSAHGAALGAVRKPRRGSGNERNKEDKRNKKDRRGRRDGGDTAAELLAPLLPRPVDHVLLQADLTAVAPGPLTTDLQRQIALMADVESKGGATVYRFGETSIRRALDAGRSADELISVLERHSATPVPQPLRYLVTDVARRHGRIRVGTASAYVRCDDPAVLDEVLADRRAALLRLRRLAPTVLASKTSRAALIDSLRAMGYSPMAESSDGDVLVTRADARRTVTPPSAFTSIATGAQTDQSDLVAAAVRAVRAGDEAHLARRHPAPDPGGEVPRSPSSTTIDALREAIREGSRVWIGYLDSQGHATSRILEPARVEGGYLTAYDETRATIHRFALSRITGITDIRS
ncbi:helicase-associated domain-containing protein [Sphaerimonospora sp. CA-214678]|uniref:helicase-associated domain-containing protein n=1 Tax=Sphaerimonospora sp. CA-214678 TaxID=3240029 RepID=UPI003D8BDFB3